MVVSFLRGSLPALISLGGQGYMESPSRVLFDGEPHPLHPQVVLGANVQEPNWEN